MTWVSVRHDPVLYIWPLLAAPTRVQSLLWPPPTAGSFYTMEVLFYASAWSGDRQQRFIFTCTLIKNKIKFSSYIRKFGGSDGKSYMTITTSSYMVKIFVHFLIILGSPSSYMTLHPIPFLIWGKLSFLFYQCTKVLFLMFKSWFCCSYAK